MRLQPLGRSPSSHLFPSICGRISPPAVFIQPEFKAFKCKTQPQLYALCARHIGVHIASRKFMHISVFVIPASIDHKKNMFCMCPAIISHMLRSPTEGPRKFPFAELCAAQDKTNKLPQVKRPRTIGFIFLSLMIHHAAILFAFNDRRQGNINTINCSGNN